MKNLFLIVVALGVCLVIGGFVYDVMFAGIPYQDPTQEMQVRYDRHAGIATKTIQVGLVASIAGVVGLVVVGLTSKKQPIQLSSIVAEDMNSWPFDQPKNCAVFTTTHVMKEGRDIAFVFHDADDHGWQFHYEGAKSLGDSMVVGLSEIVQHDPTVLEVADLPPGWKAWRKKRGDAWQRTENPSEEEGDPAGTDNDRAAPGRVRPQSLI